MGRDPRPRRFDLLIAAVAVRHGLPLLSRNVNDFAAMAGPLILIPLEVSGSGELAQT